MKYALGAIWLFALSYTAMTRLQALEGKISPRNIYTMTAPKTSLHSSSKCLWYASMYSPFGSHWSLALGMNLHRKLVDGFPHMTLSSMCSGRSWEDFEGMVNTT